MGVVPSRRFSPVLIWTLVVAVSVVLLGGSFVYAAQVGDPTVREDALRRGQRSTRTTTTLPGSFGGIGGGGVGSPPFDPATGAGGSGTFSFLAGDFAQALPPASCAHVLEELVLSGPVTLDDVTDAWTFVQTCAAAQGQSGIPALEIITADPLAQQCLAVALARTTLAYRAPTVPLGPLDQLLLECQLQGAVPPLPGLTGGLTPSSLPSGAGPGDIPGRPTAPATAPATVTTPVVTVAPSTAP